MAQNNLVFSLSLETSGLNSEVKSVADSFGKLADKAGDLNKVVNGTEKLESVMSEASKAIKSLTTNSGIEDFTASFEKLNHVVPQSLDEAKSLKSMYSTLADQMEQAGLNGTEAWNKVVDGMKKANQSVKEFQKEANKKTNIEQTMQNIKDKSYSASQEANKLKKYLKDCIDGKYNNVTDADLKKIASRIKECETQADVCKKKFESLLNDGKKLNFKDLASGLDSKMLGGMGSQMLGAIATPTGAAVAAGAWIGKTMFESGKAVSEFETHLDSLQSLTGMTNDEIKSVSDTALEMSKEYGVMASDVVDSMKLIGSQSPELLKNADALSLVTQNAIILSKAGQIDVVSAGKAITTAMNQMGVSASETSSLINTLAASSQQGAGDIDYLNTVFEKAGTNAKEAGMDYTQLSALIETVAPKFSNSAVAGTQLNSVLLKLSMSGQNEFTPAVVGMSEALNNLAQAELSDAEMKKLVGESGVTMLKAMIDGRTTFDDYCKSLKDTDTAQQQYATNTDNLDGAIQKLKASWNAFLIELGSTGVIQDMIGYIQKFMVALEKIMDAVMRVIKSFEGFGDVPSMTAPSELALNKLVELVEDLSAVLEFLVRICAKVWNYLKDSATSALNSVKTSWEDMKKKLLEIDWLNNMIKWFREAIQKMIGWIDKLKDTWNEFLKWLGMETQKKKKIELEADVKIGNSNAGNSTGSTETETEKPKTTKPKTTKSVKDEPDSGTIGDLQKKLTANNNELLNKAITDERKKQLKDENAELEKQIASLQIINSLSGSQQSLKDLQNAYSVLDNYIKNCVLSEEELKEAVKQRDGIKKQIEEQEKLNQYVDYEAGSLEDLNKKISEINTKLQKSANLTDHEIEQNKELLRQYQNQVDELEKKYSIQEKNTIQAYDPSADKSRQNKIQSRQNVISNRDVYSEMVKNGDMSLQEMNQKIQEMKEKWMSEFKDTKFPLEFDIDSGKWKTQQEILEDAKKRVQDIGNAVSGVGSLFGQLGSAIGGAGGQILSFAGQTIQSVNQLIPLINSLTQAKQGEAVASGIAEASKAPWFMIPVTIATVLASILSAFSSMGKFAEGGIVGGNSYHADAIPILAKSGEMVLNRTQQRNLFSMLDGKSGSGANNVNSSTVKFDIKSDRLVGVLKNRSNKMKRIKK